MNETYKLTMDLGSFLAPAEVVTTKLEEVNALFKKIDNTTQQYNKKGETVGLTFTGMAQNGEKLKVVLKQVNEGFRLMGSASTNAAEDIKKAAEANAKFAAVAKDTSDKIDKSLNQTLYKTASLAEKVNYKNAIVSLREYVRENQIAADKIAIVKNNLATGTPGAYTPALQGLQSRLQSVDSARGDLGSTSRDAADKAAKLQAKIDRARVDQQIAEQDRLHRFSAELSVKSAAMSEKANVAKVRAQLAADREAAASARATARAIREANDDTGRSNAGVLISWQSLARFFQARVIYDAVFSTIGAMREGTEAAKDYSIQIGLIRTLASESGGTFDQWSESVTRVSNAFGAPAVDVAKAAYSALSNQVGDTSSEVESFLNITSKFSKVAGSSAEDASNLFASLINSFQLSANDATRLSDQLFRTIDLGRVQAKDLANSIGRTAVPSNLLGFEPEELLAGIALLTKNGNTAADAQTQLLNVMNKLLSPSDALQAKLEKWGYRTGIEASKALGFVGVIKKLREEVEKNGNQSLSDEFNDLRGKRGVFSLTADSTSYNEILAGIKDSAGATNKALVEVFSTSGQKLEIEYNKIKNYFIDIGSVINNAILSVASYFGTDNNGLVNLVNGFGTALKVVAATAIPALMVALGNMVFALEAASIAFLANPVGLLLIGVSALVGGLVLLAVTAESTSDRYKKAFEQVSKSTTEASDAFVETQNKQRDAIINSVTTAGEAQAQVLAGSNAVLNAQFETLKDGFDSLKDRIKTAASEAASAFGKEISELTGHMRAVESAATRANGRVKEFKASMAENAFDDRISGLTGGAKVRALLGQSKTDANAALNSADPDILFKKAEQRLRQAEQLDKAEPTGINFAREKIALLEQMEQAEKKTLANALKTVTLDAERLKLLESQKKTVADLFTELQRLTSGDTKLFGEIGNADAVRSRADSARDNVVNAVRSSDLDAVDKESIISRVDTKMEALSAVLANREQYSANDERMREGLKKQDEQTAELRKIYGALTGTGKQVLEGQKPLRARGSVEGGFSSLPFMGTPDGGKAVDIDDINERISHLQRQLRTFTLTNPKINALLSDTATGIISDIKEKKINGFDATNLKVELGATVEQLEALRQSVLQYDALAQGADTARTAAVSGFNATTGAVNQTTDAVLRLRQAIASGSVSQLTPPTANQRMGGPMSYYAQGGLVHGSDSVPAMLSRGEFVMNSQASRTFRSQLLGMNSGLSPGGGSSSNVSVGDVNVNLSSTGSNSIDAISIGKAIKREIKRGMLKL